MRLEIVPKKGASSQVKNSLPEGFPWSDYDASVYRPMQGRIQISMPYLGPPLNANRLWVRKACGPRTHPEWNAENKTWEIARIHYARISNALIIRYGAIMRFEDYDGTEKCDLRCQNAEGEECVCSCLGQNHGINSDYYEGGEEYSYDASQWRKIGFTTLRGQSRTILKMYPLTVDEFKPIEDRKSEGFRQYSYDVRYSSTYGECPMCQIEARLITDHCHWHGWIRGKICQFCNLSLTLKTQGDRLEEIAGFIKVSAKRNYYAQVPEELAQIARCPDCYKKSLEMAKEQLEREGHSVTIASPSVPRLRRIKPANASGMRPE